jgi:hypothetical protein
MGVSSWRLAKSSGKTLKRNFLTFFNNPRKTHTGVWIFGNFGRQLRLQGLEMQTFWGCPS